MLKAHYNQGTGHFKRGEAALALADFTEAYRLDPTNADYRHALAIAHYNRFIDYARASDFPHALADLREAYRLDPSEELRKELAEFEQLLKDHTSDQKKPSGRKEKGFFGKLWSLVANWTCPKCNQRSGEEIDRITVDSRQRVHDYGRGQEIYDEWVDRIHVRCENCGHEWYERQAGQRRA